MPDQTVEVFVPNWGMSAGSAVIVEWFKQIGDAVVQGEPLLEVDAEKTTVQIDCPHAGVLDSILAGPEIEVSPGQVVGTIRVPSE